MSSDGERPGKAVLTRSVVDWRAAAELLARGLTVAEAARQVGCSRSQLSRRRNHDEVFRSWVETFQSSLPPPADRRAGSLRERLHHAIDAEVQGGNVRVILWLADRLKLINPPDRTPARSGLDELLRDMTEQDLKEFESLKD